MAKIENYLAFVKDQVAVQERLAHKYGEDYRHDIHLKTAQKFAELAKFLEEIQKKGTSNTGYLNRGDAPQKRLFLTFEEIEGAPDDLLKELNISDTDKQDMLIEYIIAESGGILSLDRIIVELYKRMRDIPKRNTITSRLFRMAGRGMIYNVPGKKGVYSTYELSEHEAKKMFGQLDEAADDPVQPQPVVAVAAMRSLGSPLSAAADGSVKAKLINSAASATR